MMTRREALAKARKRWGKRAFTEVNPDAVTGEERQRLRAEFLELSLSYKSLPQGSTERIAAYTKFKRLQGIIIQYRCGVGYTHDSFLGPMRATHGTGDSWEEACKSAHI